MRKHAGIELGKRTDDDIEDERVSTAGERMEESEGVVGFARGGEDEQLILAEVEDEANELAAA